MEEIYLDPSHHFLIRSRLLLPFPNNALIDGALEIYHQKVKRIGPYRELKKEAIGAKFIDLEDLIVMPVLTNAHVHLELSPLRFRVLSSQNFFSWVREVIRKKEALSPLEIRESVELSIQELIREGIGIIGEVTNSGLTLEPLKKSPICGFIFHEIINFKGSFKFKDLKDPSPYLKYTYSAHAPYSVSPLLLQAIKAYTKKRGRPFIIHCAESKEEVEFLKSGKGPLADLLKERGQWNESFLPPGVSPVAYLQTLGVLDEKTLLIHGIHLDEKDLTILKQNKVSICLCPRSNLYTGAGFPKVPQMIGYGIKLLLGTDSLASNDRLSLFEEMRTLLNFYPQLSPLYLLRMATSNGAETLGFEKWGTLTPSSYANFIALFSPAPFTENLEEYLREFIYSEIEVKYRFYAGLS